MDLAGLSDYVSLSEEWDVAVLLRVGQPAGRDQGSSRNLASPSTWDCRAEPERVGIVSQAV